nr:MAG TPA: hypothetical protein [Caudoviricetes sp.]DAH97448.1 MAG TPA: hypothetical protein [Bacteriophage sp.]DAN16814.1 MAG TPA: hypothetical protein [Bacteriophage sp.]
MLIVRTSLTQLAIQLRTTVQSINLNTGVGFLPYLGFLFLNIL